MYKAIIICDDHHNGLNLARMLGKGNIYVLALIISDYKKSWISCSKYINEYKIFDAPKTAFDYISNMELNFNTFLFPCSDSSALELDNRLNEFKNRCIVPGINSTQGSLKKVMDKIWQYDYALSNGIAMAKTCSLNLKEQNRFGLYPCILKPEVSASGKKADIMICNNELEFDDAVDTLINKGYENILCQEFLKNIDYEVVLVGCIYKSERKSDFSANKIIRRWPPQKGTSSFAVKVTDDAILKQCESLFELVKKTGFIGLIDIEVFFVNGELVLNEINWRNSGGDFRAINDGFNYPVWWIKDYKNEKFNSEWNHDVTYSIVEYTDIRHVFKGKVNLFKWFSNLKKAKNRALYYKNDKKPMFKKVLFKIFK